ncbi:MAG: YdcF family protein [Alphaproteobacteria bacterium]
MIKKVIFKLLFLIALIWITGYGLFVLGVLNKKPDTNIENAQAIIVLTGGNNRIHTGQDLLHQGQANKLFITGVNATVTDKDIDNLWSGNHPLPCCTELGHSATTTRENARETKEWVEKNNINTIILVTSDYHMDRALQEYTHTIPALKIYKHPVREQKHSPQQPQFWKLTFSEYNKLIFRKIILTLAKQG